MLKRKEKKTRTFGLTRWGWHCFFTVGRIKVEDKDISDGKNMREKNVLIKY